MKRATSQRLLLPSVEYVAGRRSFERAIAAARAEGVPDEEIAHANLLWRWFHNGSTRRKNRAWRLHESPAWLGTKGVVDAIRLSRRDLGVRLVGIEPTALRSGGARSIP